MSESDVNKRQIMTSKLGLHTEKVKWAPAIEY